MPDFISKYKLMMGELIAESHIDYDTHASLEAGFNKFGDFLLVLKYTDFDCHDNDYIDAAVFKKSQAFEISSSIGVKLTELPQAVLKEYGMPLDTGTASDVIRMYKYSLLPDLMDCGGRYNRRILPYNRDYGLQYYP